MTAQARRFNIFISFTVYLSFTFHKSHGFEVIQPQNQTVNSDGSAAISCEHTANGTIVDVRLIGIASGDKTMQTKLCQKGMDTCDNIIMHQENPNKFLFILLNTGPMDMNRKYECEFTVKCDNDVDYTRKGRPTVLLPAQMDSDWSAGSVVPVQLCHHLLLHQTEVQQQSSRQLHLCCNEESSSAKESTFRHLLWLTDSAFFTTGLTLTVMRGKTWIVGGTLLT